VPPVIAAMRPKQWIKNVLVAVAPVAGGVMFHSGVWWHVLVAFAAFSVSASGLYIFNDINDVESDKLHPKKSRRPIASGALGVKPARGVAIGCLLAGLLLCMALPLSFFLILAAYIVITQAYSFGLKRQAVIELACVASGFVLRALAGGAATNTHLSVWFVLVVSFGALFVVTGKRLAEMPREGVAGEKRVVLADYTKSFLESVLTLSATAAILAYCLWSFSSSGVLGRAHVHVVLVQLSVLPVVLAVLYILLLLDGGKGGAPEELAVHDRTLQILGVGWVLLLVTAVYL